MVLVGSHGNFPVKGIDAAFQDLEINGKDLIQMGVPQGQRIGEVLNTIFDRVVDEPELNNREILIKMAKEIIG